jgi:hypothetical protein
LKRATDYPYIPTVLHAVAETPSFQRDAAAAGMSDAEKAELIAFLAANPEAGEIMVGTGGARKLRWKRPDTGKSGGFRIITYYAGRALPLFLLTLYAKGERANLSASERNTLRGILSGIAASYRGRAAP